MKTLTKSTHSFLHIDGGNNRRSAKAASDDSTTLITGRRGGRELIRGGSCLGRAFDRKEVPAFGGREEDDGAVVGSGSELDCR